MKNIKQIFFIIILIAFSFSSYSAESPDPKGALIIKDWSFYGTWGSVAIIHNLIIENKSDKAFENLKVRICYSTDSTKGNFASTQIGVLNISIPPKSENTYLKKGITLGAGAQSMKAIAFEIIDAEVVN